jgi:hypothetical protein
MITITAFASVYVILLTVLPLFFHVSEFLTSSVNAATIVFSLIILASSLLQYSNNDPVRAEQHHRCALEVNALRRELRSAENCSSVMVAEFGKRFDEILQKYSINHDDIDFDKYKVEHPDEYPKGVTDSEKKEVARKVERAQSWTAFVLAAMSTIAAAVASSAAYVPLMNFLSRLFH